MIRHANEKDIHSIMDIYNYAIKYSTATYEETIHTFEEQAIWFEDRIKKGFPVIVFEQDGNVVAYGSYAEFKPRTAYRFTVEHSIYVAEGVRRQGIGRKLLQKLIQLAREQGLKTMVALIDEDTVASSKLHEYMGFHYCGTLKKVGYKFGKYLNLNLYQLELE